MRRRTRLVALGGLVAAVGATAAFAGSGVKTGPSSSQSPYVVPVAATPPGVSTRSLLTVGDSPVGQNYPMVGIPDGLGAYDNGNGTFTLLMNHELGSGVGATRAHGAKGAFVSKWTIDKSNLAVISGSDLIQNVYTAKDDGTYNPDAPVAFSRFCSADLPAPTALWNPASGKGYDGRVYLNGEESGVTGRAFAHFVTGPEAGNSYELPYLGRLGFENVVAHPNAGDRTIVMAQDDTSPSASVLNSGQVYVYAGDKSATGDAVTRAGLAYGSLYGIQVRIGGAPLATEFSKTDWVAGNEFPFAAVDVSADRKSGGSWSGTNLQNRSVAKNVTGFERPEDGAWDPNNPTDYYFVTTSIIVKDLTADPGRNGHTRLWRLRFADPTQPQLGGTITLLIDGPVSTSDPGAFGAGPKMFDNITVSKSGQIVLQEDPGDQAYVAKVWLYDIASGELVQIGQHDPERFRVGAPGFLTKDEESSGVIDVSDILGQGWYLFDVQAHYPNGPTLVEGGQLLAFHIPPGKLGQLVG